MAHPSPTPARIQVWPQWGEREREELLATLDSGAWWTGDGERAFRFARDFAQYQGAAAGYPFTNGTQTLEAALVACGVGEGDEVIVPGMTFVASASAVLAVNATPVIVDVDPETLCIDPAAAEAAIGERTRAIIAVHVAGAVCDLDLLVPLCERRALHLIEDCAHAHGSQWRGRGAGSYGSFGSFSMQQGKLMTAGEGGALIGNDPQLLDAAWNYADCGRERGRWFYHHATIGSNFRMTEWQGAVLLAQLERFPEQHALRNANAIALGEALAQVPGLRAQKRDERMDSQGNYCFVVHYDSQRVRRHAAAPVRGGAVCRRRAARRELSLALRPGRVPQSQLRSHAASLGSVARLREPPPARGRARRRLDRLDGAPAAAGRARPRPAGRRGRCPHPRARGRHHGEAADRRLGVTARLAVLGCGWVADMHTRAAATAGHTVAGVANHRLESAERFASEHGIERVTTDWRALVSAPDIDVVVVCTPNALHAEQSIAALEAGKHVLCEKPMATTVVDAEAMLEAAARHDRLLLVLHPWRHHEAVIAVRDAIAAGELGRVVRTHGYGVHADWGPGGWFTDPALAGGGALVDMGIHAIDTARFLLGEPQPRRVVASIRTAHGDYAVDDDGIVLIEWESGARSVVESGWWQPHLAGHEADTEVYGSTGYRRIWAREQPPGYVHCDVTLFIAQLRDAMAQIAAWQPGTPSPRNGLEALRICELAYASAGVGSSHAG